tara:strand:- start:184 stop:675 length:492 start_codon:yes stop_codon:yes gene_type:complete
MVHANPPVKVVVVKTQLNAPKEKHASTDSALDLMMTHKTVQLPQIVRHLMRVLMVDVSLLEDKQTPSAAEDYHLALKVKNVSTEHVKTLKVPHVHVQQDILVIEKDKQTKDVLKHLTSEDAVRHNFNANVVLFVVLVMFFKQIVHLEIVGHRERLVLLHVHAQ